MGTRILLWLALFFLQSQTARTLRSGPTGCSKEGYKSNSEIETFLLAMNAKYPKITRLFDIGLSTGGLRTWGIEISTTPGKPDIPKPNLKYIGNLHGDEVVGRELLIRLIEYVLSQYSSTQDESSRIRHLLQKTNLFIVPTVNPDGFNQCSRGNKNGIDLNRNFPDQFRAPAPANMQIETRNIIDWVSKGKQFDKDGKEFEKFFRFTLSANFHGGDVVVNYPLDGKGKGFEKGITDDDELFRHISSAYASKNPLMMKNTDFHGGITNGVAWYPLYGGMQDWNYVWQGCMETTVEVSCSKWPKYSEMDLFWEENRDSLLSYWEMLISGVWGKVTDTQGRGLDASVTLKGGSFKVHTQHGHYFRLLSAEKSYTLVASAPGYLSEEAEVEYTGERIELNFVLRGEDELGKAEEPFIEDTPEPITEDDEETTEEPPFVDDKKGGKAEVKDVEVDGERENVIITENGEVEETPNSFFFMYVIVVAVVVGLLVFRRSRRRLEV